MHGYTHTVHLYEFVAVDLRKWTAGPKEKMEEFWKAWVWWARVEEKDAALNNDQGIAFILDFHGYSLQSMASPAGNHSNFFTSSILINIVPRSLSFPPHKP